MILATHLLLPLAVFTGLLGLGQALAGVFLGRMATRGARARCRAP